jgi:hypothetical protein
MRALLLLPLLAACAEIPAVAARIPEAEVAAAPPPLLPITDLLAAADAQGGAAPDAGLAAEVAALQARAAALRGPVLSEEDRARLALQ